MAEKYQSDDSDDFFDMHTSAKEGAGYGRDEWDKLSNGLELDRPGKGASMRDKHRSVSHSDQGASRGYSSDSATDSEIEIKNKKHDRAKLQSRSSSRSGGSYSSDDSYSSAERRSRLRSKQSRENHSRSRSLSGSRSRSRSPDSTAYVSEESKTRRRYRSTSSGRVSDSDGKETGRLSGSSESDDNGFRQAWKVEVKHHSERRHRSQNDEHCPTEKRPPRDKNSKHKRVRSGDRGSDSDITDVSPIPSPRADSPGEESQTNPRSKILKGVDKPSKRVTDSGDIDSLDLNILLKAVKEMEKQNRIKANTRKVMFEPQGAKRMEKANYTFSNDDTRRIDQENQRLLHKIMHRMHQEDPKRPQGGRPKLKQPTPSAVNRRRDHQKIENENLVRLLSLLMYVLGVSKLTFT